MAQVIVPQSNAGRYLQEGLSSAGSAFADAMKERRALQLQKEEQDRLQKEQLRREKVAQMIRNEDQQNKIRLKAAEMGISGVPVSPAPDVMGVGVDPTMATGARGITPVGEANQAQLLAEISKRAKQSASTSKNGLEIRKRAMDYIDGYTSQEDLSKRISQASLETGLPSTELAQDFSVMKAAENFGFTASERNDVVTIVNELANKRGVPKAEIQLTDPEVNDLLAQKKIARDKEVASAGVAGQNYLYKVSEDTLAQIQSEANSAYSRAVGIEGAIAQIEAAKEEGKDITGMMSDLKIKVGNFFNSFNINPAVVGVSMEEVGTIEQLSAAFNKLVIEDLGNFKGALSNKELMFATKANPNIKNSQLGNLVMLKLLRITSKRAMERRKFVNNAIRSGTASDPLEAVTMWEEELDRRGEAGDVDMFVNKKGEYIFRDEWSMKAERDEAQKLYSQNPNMDTREMAKQAALNAEKAWRNTVNSL